MIMHHDGLDKHWEEEVSWNIIDFNNEDYYDVSIVPAEDIIWPIHQNDLSEFQPVQAWGLVSEKNTLFVCRRDRETCVP
jgi:hypothetical protein